jgi:hypothetical protein
MPPTSTSATTQTAEPDPPGAPGEGVPADAGGPERPPAGIGRGMWLGALGSGLLALLGAAFTIRLWRADLAAPFRYAQLDDTKFYLALIRSIVRHGWFHAGTSLGAPFGQQLHDFPQGADNLNFLVIRMLALFSGNPGLIANLFFLLTFPLCAASAFVVMRKLGVAAGPTTVAAVLFALLPYHFYRGESQLLLSAYWSVPLSAWLFLSPLVGEPLFRRRPAPARGPTAWLSRRSAATVLLCAVIASTGLYYAAFGLVLLGAGSVAAALARRGRAAAVGSLLCAALIGTGLVANYAPDLLYRAQHGANPLLVRSVADTELLALKPAQLLLPVQGHRLGLLRNLNGDYAKAVGSGYCEQCYETLGTVGDVGFLWLLGGLLASVLGTAWLLRRERLYPPMALGVLLSLLIASVGGVSSLFSYFVTPDVRGWNRMSLFIAFFSLAAAACLLGAGLRALARRGVHRLWLGAAVAAVLVLGGLDETSDDFIPAYAVARAEYRADTAFFGEVEARLGRGAAVFELPYVPFPEGYGAAVNGLNFASPNYGTTYEEARGYIASASLRWSYGAMKGRPADWESELDAKPIGTAVAAAALSGFTGLVVQPAAYTVGPAVLRAALSAQLGEAPLVSRWGGVWFFDLRPYAARLRGALGPEGARAVRTATLTPLRVRCGGGAVTLTGAPGAGPAPAVFTADFSGLSPATGPYVLRWPDGSLQTLAPRKESAAVRRELAVAPGSSTIALLSPTPTPTHFEVQVTGATLTVPALAALARGGPSSISAGYPPPACTLHPGLAPLPTTPTR